MVLRALQRTPVEGLAVWPYGVAHRRRFFDFYRNSDKLMKYTEKRIIGFTAEQMFDVVNNVTEYPNFVPWCKQVQVRKLSDSVTEAELQIGFPPLRETYTSKVTSLRPYVVKSVVIEGRLFNVLDTTWRFRPLPEQPNCCELFYSLEFEFRSLLHTRFAQMFFDLVVRTMVMAFLKRAEQLYGSPAISYDRMVPTVTSSKR